jgi:hypothetical protein
VDKLITATKGAQHEAHDPRLLLLMFRHGLRVPEALRGAYNPAKRHSKIAQRQAAGPQSSVLSPFPSVLPLPSARPQALSPQSSVLSPFPSVLLPATCFLLFVHLFKCLALKILASRLDNALMEACISVLVPLCFENPNRIGALLRL